MENLFKTLPWLHEIDVDKLSATEEVGDEYGSDDDSDDSSDWRESEMMYGDKPLLAKVQLKTNRMDLKDIHFKMELPERFNEKLKELDVKLLHGCTVFPECYDKYYNPLYYAEEMLHRLLDAEHEAIASLECLSYGWRWRVVAIHFHHSTSLTNIYDDIKELRRTLDKPGNLGSLDGWIECVKMMEESSLGKTT